MNHKPIDTYDKYSPGLDITRPTFFYLLYPRFERIFVLDCVCLFGGLAFQYAQAMLDATVAA